MNDKELGSLLVEIKDLEGTNKFMKVLIVLILLSILYLAIALFMGTAFIYCLPAMIVFYLSVTIFLFMGIIRTRKSTKLMENAIKYINDQNNEFFNELFNELSGE